MCLHRGKPMRGDRKKADVCKAGKERGLRRNQTCTYFILGVGPPELLKNKFLLVDAPSSCYLVIVYNI